MTTETRASGPGDPPDGDIHDTSWSLDLERAEYADAPDRTVTEAVAAVERTAPGRHVNIVTHANLGHPSTFLHDALRDRFGSGVEVEYVDQCGCGGHVTRAHVGEADR